jgi:hypothetical protein
MNILISSTAASAEIASQVLSPKLQTYFYPFIGVTAAERSISGFEPYPIGLALLENNQRIGNPAQLLELPKGFLVPGITNIAFFPSKRPDARPFVTEDLLEIFRGLTTFAIPEARDWNELSQKINHEVSIQQAYRLLRS